jgi:glycosyltransferase involved in cell wall biosynthesis
VVLRSGVAPTPTALHERLWRWLIDPLVTQHVANSQFTAAELAGVGVSAETISVIGNIAPRRTELDTPAMRIPGRVAYVGQVIPEKGVMQLLEAVALLTGRGVDVTLDIVGQMEGWAPDRVLQYRAALQSRASRRDLAGRVRFLGWREDIASVLRAASVHCCPSQPEQREAFGITVVEAKRAGVPSVVCPSGALAELIEHQRDGWITDGFDANAIADGIEWFVADDARLASAQRAAGEAAKRFSAADFERRWQQTFGMHTRSASGTACEFAGARGALP